MSHQSRLVVDCSNSDLQRLPNNISANIQALILVNNRLKLEMLSSLIKLRNLTELDISGNHLFSLEGTYLDIPTLLYLTVDRNDLDYLASHGFLGTPDLIFLSAADNKIEIMSEECFQGLHALKHLDLSGNRIFSLNAAWFLGLVSLETLDLQGNNIHALTKAVFRSLLHLQFLKLNNNQIKHTYSGAFYGLARLRQLYLDHNHLQQVPTEALDDFPHLDVLDMSGNPIVELATGSVKSVNMSVFRLNQMGVLRLVEAEALMKLPYLQRLELANNPHLQYIHRGAFSQVPNLRALELHNNLLTVLEKQVVEGLDHLNTLTLHGNPLYCDCMVNWLRQLNRENKRNTTLENIEQVTCAGPDNMKDKSLDAEELKRLPTACPPRILPLFNTQYERVLGDPLQFDCRVVGEPLPQTEWLLPAHAHGDVIEGVEVLKPGSAGAHGTHKRVTEEGTLYIDYIQGTDHGDYTCSASNPAGRDERTAHVHVKNLHANLIIIHVTQASVTVTWSNTRHSHDYQIMYKPQLTNITYHEVSIRPYMRTYTVAQLLPDTAYEFCLGIKHEKDRVKINCTAVSTHKGGYARKGVVDTRNYFIGGALACFVLILFVTCSMTYVLKRYNKRRREQDELYSDNLSQLFLASMDSMSDTTPITYENRGAEMFDEDDLEEIRSTASMPSTNTGLR